MRRLSHSKSVKYTINLAKRAISDGSDAQTEPRSEFSQKLYEFSQNQTTANLQISVPKEQEVVSVAGLLDGNDTFRKVWDVVIAISLLYVSVITPYDISFLEEATAPKYIEVCNYILDAVFGLDIILNFCTVYYDKASGQLVVSRRQIAINYLSGWFTIDVLSILPFDIIFGASANEAERDSSAFQRLPQLIRVLRLTKLTKLLRVFRIRVILSRVEAQLGVHYGMINLSKSLITILFASHWMACTWHMATFLSDDPNETWLSTADLKPTAPEAEKYVASLYWAVMTLTTIGYGDVVANTTAERSLAIGFQVIAAVLFSMVIGNVSAVLQSFNVQRRRYEEEMDRLNEYMEANRLPAQLRTKIHDFFQYKHTHTVVHNSNVLEVLSAPLRGEVVLWGSRKMVERVSFFKDADLEFMSTIAMLFKPEIYAPHNVIFKVNDLCTGLYLVEAGWIQILMSNNDPSTARHVTTGETLGEDVLINRYHHSSAASITYSSVLKIMKAQLAEVLNENPTVAQAMKQEALRGMLAASPLRSGPISPESSRKTSVSRDLHPSVRRRLHTRDREIEHTPTSTTHAELTNHSQPTSPDVTTHDTVSAHAHQKDEPVLVDEGGAASGTPLPDAASGTDSPSINLATTEDAALTSLLLDQSAYDLQGLLFTTTSTIDSEDSRLHRLTEMDQRMAAMMNAIGRIGAEVDHTTKWMHNTEQQVESMKAQVDSLESEVQTIVNACQKTQADVHLVVRYLDEIKDWFAR